MKVVLKKTSLFRLSVGQWAGRRSNPRLRFFRPLLIRLSYQPNKKGQVSRVTPGPVRLEKGAVSQAQRKLGQGPRRVIGEATKPLALKSITAPHVEHGFLKLARVLPDTL